MRVTLEELYAQLIADADARHEAAVSQITSRFVEYRGAQAPPVAIVQAGESLQAALDAGGPVRLENGVVAVGTFRLRSGTRLTLGAGATLQGGPGPTLLVPCGTSDIEVVGNDDAMIRSSGEIVALLGENTDRQTTLDAVPRNIRLRNLTCPTHRGKRVFEVNATQVLLDLCVVRDHWDIGLQDSQAIGILNSPGDVTVTGGVFETASENIMIGGDKLKLTGGVRPTGFRFDGVRLTKPLSWRSDGVKRQVKNLFELKDGEDVTLSRSVLENHWQEAQPGWSVVITPRTGGAIRNVTIHDCSIRNVPAGFNITGHNTGNDELRWPTPFRTANITLRDVLIVTATGVGGNGVLVQQTNGGCDGLTLTRVRAITHGSSCIVAGDKEPCGSLVMTGCHAHAGKYGFFIGGRINALNPLWHQNPDGTPAGGYEAFHVLGNVFTDFDAPELPRNLPGNTFLARPDFDALFVDPAAGDWRLKAGQPG